MAKVLNPNQDLKINAGLMQMWKKAGLRVKSFKATKKGHNEIWAGKFKTKNAVLEMSVDKYGNVFYHAGNKSVNMGRLDKQRKIIDWMKAIIRNAPWAESVEELKEYMINGIEVKDFVDKALKKAGIKATKYLPMKSGWLGSKFVWGAFYTVRANKRKDVLPFTVDKKGNLHLNVSPKKFIIGKIGKLPQVVKNLKDFKKSDLDVYESVNEAKINEQSALFPVRVDMKVDFTDNETTEESFIDDIEKAIQGVIDTSGVNVSWTVNGYTIGESVSEDIVRGNEVHAKTKRELKAAIARSMMEILKGKVPKYDIINGRTGEMIGWKEKNEYIWQPGAIPYAERELK